MQWRFDWAAAKPSRIIAIIVAIVALVVVVFNVYSWAITHRSILLLNRDRPQLPITALFVPTNAPATISLIANLDELVNLNRLAVPAAHQLAARRAMRQWQQQIGARLHLNYRREIAPWLGEEITVAMTALDFDRIPRNGAQPGYLAILSSRNPEVSSRTIQAWWAKQVATNRLKFETYQGIKLGYNRRDQLASAIVNDRYIVFANHPQVLKAAIDSSYPPQLSIRDNPDYQQVVAANSHHKIGIGYARLPALNQWLGPAAGAQYPIAGINVGVDRQGLIADLSLYPLPPAPTDLTTTVPPPLAATPPTLVNTLSYLPRQSQLAVAGRDLAHWQQQLATMLPELKTPISLIDHRLVEIGNQLNIDLSTEGLSWVTGEYGLAAIADPIRQSTDWAMIAERTQPEQTDQAIAHFDELASQAGYQVGLLPWPGQQVVGWTKLVTETGANPPRLIAEVAGVHTTIANKYTIIASSIAALDATLKAISSSQQSILASDRYQRGTNLITATETGYIYGNWQTIRDLLLPQLPHQTVIKSISDGLLAGLPNLSISSYVEAGISRITLLFQVE